PLHAAQDQPPLAAAAEFAQGDALLLGRLRDQDPEDVEAQRPLDDDRLLPRGAGEAPAGTERLLAVVPTDVAFPRQLPPLDECPVEDGAPVASLADHRLFPSARASPACPPG